ncbi:MAG: thioredoxin [SAR86 cluster bacterium]|uniref:Thiol:disulfide interchange protein n=1 Tax=SAR86 cluster bacterium TaxID=2030880 RepID=A0A520N5G3_9GAMM|nr:MAG: thioredoxin [SAR86 cluster bacterium]
MKYKLLMYSLILFSLTTYSDELLIKEKISGILPPGTQIEKIEESSFPNIYKVYYGDIQPLYVSKSGKYFLYGDMFEINSSEIINLTALDIKKQRISLMKEINQDELISFSSDDEIYSVTVFTDVDCGYCRKLHNEIKAYNKLGISINYAAFPRSGIGTEAFTKMVGAWCSTNPKKSITYLKDGKKLDLNICDSQPVSKHYAIGKKIGITGTPAIISSEGELFPGYYSPQDLLDKLKS